MKKLIAFLFVLFILVIAYWADTDSMPEVIKALIRFPNGDRLGHFVLYGLLAFLLAWAFPKRSWLLRQRGWFPVGSLVAVVGAALEEISQLFFVNRTADLVDLGCGLLGILFATLLTNKLSTNTLEPATFLGLEHPMNGHSFDVSEQRSLKMKVNESAVDRVIRVILGIVLLALGLFGIAIGAWMWVAYILGAILLATGIIGFCPLYALLKLNTNTK